MNKLTKTQSTFLHYIKSNQLKDNDFVIGDDRLSAQQRLDIYAEAYRLRLLDALSDTYPAVHTLLGDDDFENLGLEYIQTFPSTHFSVRYFGANLDEFLSSHPDFSSIPILSEMANFEWSIRDVFDAINATPFTLQDMANIEANTWPNLTFTLIPAVKFCHFKWNTVSLWKAVIQEEDPQAPYELEKTQKWVIWRPQLETVFESLDEEESFIFNTIQQKNNFSEICEKISLEYGTDPEQMAAQFLLKWIGKEIVLKVQQS